MSSQVHKYSRSFEDEDESHSTWNTQSYSRNSDPSVLMLRDGKSLYWNFILFSLLYSIAHATVDAVLAFSAAELGSSIGSYGGFALYICYTGSAFFLAKPVLGVLSSKTSVFLGLLGLLCYVGSFFLAILFPRFSLEIFVSGASVGGIGAGVLWTAQGSYYASNSKWYSHCHQKEFGVTNSIFASIFSGVYLGIEAAFKFLATFVYLVQGGNSSWKAVIFGFYTAISFVSIVLFWYFIIPLEAFPQEKDSQEFMSLSCENNEADTCNALDLDPLSNSRHQDDPDTSLPENLVVQDEAASKSILIYLQRNFRRDALHVFHAILSNRQLQLVLPFQLCFGFSASLIEYYVNGIIVKNSLGDGYIGALSSIITVTAVLLAGPWGYLASSFSWGKHFIIIVGGVCFLFGGLPLLLASDTQLGTWTILVLYFMVHGCCRGIWEGINKAVILDFFPMMAEQDVAFASIYFCSGLSGAIGFISYQSMSKSALAWLNTLLPLLATISYHFAFVRNSSKCSNHPILPMPVTSPMSSLGS